MEIGEDYPGAVFVDHPKLGLNDLSSDTIPKKPFEKSGFTVITSARIYFPRDKFAVLYYEREQ